MQTVLRILERAGGYRPTLYLKVENPPYMALVIEAVPGRGPLGCPARSVAHYGEQNGDLMRDPEMCFEWSQPQYSRYLDGANYLFVPPLYEAHRRFAALWNRNLRDQRFLEALSDKSIRG